MTRFWIGVASRDHVKVGEAGGFCQLGHGKEASVRRLSPGDGITYYAPRTGMKTGDPVKGFVAVGQIQPGGVYRAEQSAYFHPYRRDVAYFGGQDAPIGPLLDHLSFGAGGANWGLLMRRGLFEITAQDFGVIATSMGVSQDIKKRFFK